MRRSRTHWTVLVLWLPLVASEAATPSPSHHLMQGIKAFEADDLKVAGAQLAEARKLKPQWYLAHLYWGMLQRRIDPKSEAALAALEHAAELAPENPRCHLHLGLALQAAGRFSEAAAALGRAVEIRPGLDTAQTRLAVVLRRLGRLDEAVAILESLRQRDPSHLENVIRLAEVLEQLGRLAEAEPVFRDVVALVPERAEHRYHLLDFYERTGAEDRADVERQRLAELWPETVAHRDLFDQGDAALAARDTEQARELFTKARALAPDWFLPHLYWAITESKLNPEGGDVLAALNQAVALAPHNPRCHYRLGVEFIRIKDFVRAEASLRRAIDLRSDVGEVHFDLGRVLHALGRKQEALEAFEKAREYDPNHLAALAVLAELYEEYERYADAEKVLRRITGFQPEIAYHHYRLAEFLERIGQERKAQRVRRRVDHLDPRPKRKMRRLHSSPR